MASLQSLFVALFSVLILSEFSCSEAKKKKKGLRHFQKDPFRDMCRAALRNGSHKGLVNLQAFFDLRKSFACLRMETCSFVPLCFVEETPDLGQENLNNCALWNILLHDLKNNRRIEPVMDNSVGAPRRTDYSWDDAVSSFCYGVSVYRFLPPVEENVSAQNGTTATSDLSGQRNSTGQNSTADSPLTDSKQKKKRHRRGGPFNRLLRHFKRAKTIGVRNSSCGGLEACTRICVGQNEGATNSSDCMTFKIQCTTRVPKNRKKSKGKGKRKHRD